MNEITITAKNGTSDVSTTAQQYAVAIARQPAPASMSGGLRLAPVANLRRPRKRRWMMTTSAVEHTSRTPSTPADAGFASVSPTKSLNASTAMIGLSSASTKGTPKFSSVSINTSRAPASIDGITIGKVTLQKVRQRDAPRFWLASSTETSSAFRPATVGNRTYGYSVNT